MTLKQEVVAGAKWSTAGMASTTLARFVALAVLARLLQPSDFGLMGMILFVIGIAQAFADVGFSHAIIQRPNPTREQLSSLYWLNILAGWLIFGTLMLIAPLVVRYYDEPRLGSLVYIAALSFVISPIGLQFKALMQKELRFRRLAGVEAVSGLANAVVSVSFALAHFGVYSLMYGQLAGAVAEVIALVSVTPRSWRPQMHFHVEDLRGYAGFGAYQMGERVLNFLAQNVDYLVIGKYLGATPLGYYTLAYNLISYPHYRISPIISRVALPAFARVQQDGEAMSRGYLKSISVLSLVNFPLTVGLGIAARPLILALYGGRWEPAVILVQILLVIGLIKSLSGPMAAAILARGKANVNFLMHAVIAATNILVCWFFVHRGVVAMSIALLVSYLIRYVITHAFLINWLIGVRPADYFRQLGPALSLSAIMGGSLLLLQYGLFRPLDVLQSPAPALTWIVCAGVAVYFAAARWRYPALLAEMRDLVVGKGRIGQGTGRPAVDPAAISGRGV